MRALTNAKVISVMTKEIAMSQLLEQLKQLMLSDGLWQSEELPSEAFNSNAPFFCDTMSFFQWLQFVFVPKMNDCCLNHSLPSSMALTPMAEMSFDNSSGALKILKVLTKMDTLICKVID